MASNAARRSFKVLVHKLPWTISKRELNEYFSQFGHVRLATVIFDKGTGLSRGFGIVQFDRQESYISALQQNIHIIDNSKVFVDRLER